MLALQVSRYCLLALLGGSIVYTVLFAAGADEQL